MVTWYSGVACSPATAGSQCSPGLSPHFGLPVLKGCHITDCLCDGPRPLMSLASHILLSCFALEVILGIAGSYHEGPQAAMCMRL